MEEMGFGIGYTSMFASFFYHGFFGDSDGGGGVEFVTFWL